jgi:ABC-type Fe3+-citrate transport system substrate-binding protein
MPIQKNAKQKRGKESGAFPISLNIGQGVGGNVNIAQGNIHLEETHIHSNNIAVDKHSEVTTTLDAEQIEYLFKDIRSKLDQQKTQGIDGQQTTDKILQEIENEVKKGDSVNQSRVESNFEKLAKMGPDILEVVTASLVNPAAGISVVVKKIAEKARLNAK